MASEDRPELDALLEQLYHTYRLPILNYLYRLVGDRAQAEDLTQEVFVRAYRALERLPDEANHRAWLYRIATNLGIDQLRRRRLLRWLPVREADGAPATPGPDADGVEEALATHDAVQAALAQVPPALRAPLILFSVQGYSLHEIAGMLGTSEGAVKTRLSRAREAFRRAYQGGA